MEEVDALIPSIHQIIRLIPVRPFRDDDLERLAKHDALDGQGEVSEDPRGTVEFLRGQEMVSLS
jgi:muconolactone delta-isomerase